MSTRGTTGEPVDWSSVDAVLFDLDGVITPTAEVHMHAWAEMFKPFLEERGASPYSDKDYFAHIDGKPRYEGVAALLEARDIDLPWGDPADASDQDSGDETVCGLGNRKNDLFGEVLARDGVEAYPGSLRLLDALEERGTRMAIVSSSANAPDVLRAAGILDRFDTVVDGSVAKKRELPGKPRPDTYEFAADELERAAPALDRRRGRGLRRAGRCRRRLRVRRRGRPWRRRRHLALERRRRGRRRPRGARRRRERWRAMTADPSNVGASHTPPRAEDLLDRHIFPIDPWSLTECQYDPWHLGRNETIFAVANGYLGMRGNVEEGRDSYAHGTYINGFHETFQIQHAEEAFGFARVGQTMVNVPDAKLIRLYVDDEPLLLSIADLEHLLARPRLPGRPAGQVADLAHARRQEGAGRLHADGVDDRAATWR